MESHLVSMKEHSWVFLYRSFDGSNDGKLEVVLLGDSTVIDDGTELGFWYG